ncbi:hypothetical protein AACH10_16675 [Ideonella sp. DXS22W]|uniref:STAS/SEC14 domain-containing protein n=1 Tax=Pseudaquabacterium inlustre TaxID=2984192 RepID=A0ABU9CMD4_9BURK
MPYTLHWEAPDGVLRRYTGRVTADERRESFERICADPRFDRLRYAITDYLGVTDYEVRAESTEEIAALHVAPLLTNPGIRIAAVATQPAVLAAIAHFKALGFIGDQPYGVFDTEAQARQWIADLPRPLAVPRRHLL